MSVYLHIKKKNNGTSLRLYTASVEHVLYELVSQRFGELIVCPTLLFLSVPYSHAPDRYGHATIRSDITTNAGAVEVQEDGLGATRQYSGGFHCAPIPRHTLVRHQHVRLLWNIVSSILLLCTNEQS